MYHAADEKNLNIKFFKFYIKPKQIEIQIKNKAFTTITDFTYKKIYIRIDFYTIDKSQNTVPKHLKPIFSGLCITFFA